MEDIRRVYRNKVLRDYKANFEAKHVLKELPTVEQERPIKIGILGAGAAGLYAAMMIDSLEDPTITYEILEADHKRHGGRLFTHRFEPTGRKDDPLPGFDDYYDVGAMRFPDIPFMRRTFHLFQHLGITEHSKQLIPYVMSIDENMNYYNGKHLTNAQIGTGGVDPFQIGLTEAYSDLIDAKLKGYEIYLAEAAEISEQELEKRFEELYSIMDNYSTRSFFAATTPSSPSPIAPLVPGYSQRQISDIETFDSGSDMYDSAVLETVLDRMDFHWPNKKVKWFCVHGGTKVVADAMADKINGKITYDAPVTGIVPQGPHPAPIDIYTAQNPLGSEAPQGTYNHVINTLPFSCLRNVDYSRCNFSWDLQKAIRCLRYGTAVKVAIRFRLRWWETERKMFGGVSGTDRPTRVVVYPSYGIGSTDSATMIVSYSWEMDALRLGSMCRGKGSAAEQKLLSIILRDLSDMHGYKDYGYLPKLVVDYHAWNWYGDEAAGGGFAHFGPGQFSTLYPLVTQPHNGGNFHFAGEATSIHHAWLVGALDSAYRCVHGILTLERKKDSKILKLFEKKWNNPVPTPEKGAFESVPAPSEWSDDLVDDQLRIGIS